jgi:flavin-dependent dehydrogenase
VKTISIRGGGPAGLAAAIGLAQNGRSVKVLERPGYPGRMARSGFQTLEDFTREEGLEVLLDTLGIRGKLDAFPVSQATLFDHRRLPHGVSSEAPFVHLIRRGAGPGALDRVLYERAASLGVEFGAGDNPPAIIATGPAQADGVSLERHFTTDGATRVWVYFDAALAPGGYAYLFTRGGQGTFGTAVTRDFGRLKEHAASCWEAFLSLEAFPAEVTAERGSWMNFYIPKHYSAGGALYVGEAAGLQDFLFGLGMRLAMESGLLAARALLEGLDYGALARRRFGPELGRGVVHRFLYERMGNGALARALEGFTRGDYRRRLRRLSAGSAIYPLLLPFVRVLCKNRGTCRHPLQPHWCRRSGRTTGTAAS